MPEKDEPFANPQAPANYHPDDIDQTPSHPLTNDDFRKLLMTPAVGTQRSSTVASSSQAKTVKSATEKDAEAADRRKKKKLNYAKFIKEEKLREEERAKKYRDRARERRDRNKDLEDTGVLPTQSQVQQQPSAPTTSAGNYRAVAPDAKGNYDAAARRKQIIEESKFLGGDLEHTHLVKGLDYALLQKVRAEITTKDDFPDQSGVDGDEQLFAKPVAPLPPTPALTTTDKKKTAPNKQPVPKPTAAQQQQQRQQMIEDEEENRLGIKSKLAKNVFRTLFRNNPLNQQQQPNQRKINELFLPHRMAYVIDLESDQDNQNGLIDDIPTTLIRSKADCPNAESTTTLSNNDIVINKLTQILSYLRHSKRDIKRQKKKGGGIEHVDTIMNIKPQNTNSFVKKSDDVGIYDDVGDYVPDTKRRSAKEEQDANRRRNYFSGLGEQQEMGRRDRSNAIEDEEGQSENNGGEAVKNFIKNVHRKYENKSIESRDEKGKKGGFQLKFNADSYAECYPGTMAEEDVNIDSDDEPDYDKMDMGSKKGPIGRWDFDTAEEYSDYMSQKEAMPKAAFQYGVKMSDGRKTRKSGPKDEKQKIDREWQQISKIIDKRKGGGGDESPNVMEKETTLSPDNKKDIEVTPTFRNFPESLNEPESILTLDNNDDNDVDTSNTKLISNNHDTIAVPTSNSSKNDDFNEELRQEIRYLLQPTPSLTYSTAPTDNAKKGEITMSQEADTAQRFRAESMNETQQQRRKSLIEELTPYEKKSLENGVRRSTAMQDSRRSTMSETHRLSVVTILERELMIPHTDDKISSIITVDQIQNKNKMSHLSGILWSFFATFALCTITFLTYFIGLDLIFGLSLQMFAQTIAFLIYAIYKNYNILGPPEYRLQMIIRGLVIGLGSFTGFIAYYYIPLPDLSAIRQSQVVWTIILCIIFLKERLTIQRLIACILTLFAIILISRPTILFRGKILPLDSNSTVNIPFFSSSAKSWGYLIGALLALTTAIAFSVSTVINKLLLNAKLPNSVICFWSSMFALVISIISLILTHFVITKKSLPHDRRLFAGCGIAVASILVMIANQKAIKREKASIVTLIYSTEIVLALFLQNVFTVVKSDWIVVH
ncbi:unnamed protein product [Didymodactylos carnosus]|uniref:Protein Red n=1 Tax=Didymodactylos carnosus TaxID=1234261 RepID=A0A8S2D8G6_9BILA|nr:unnamed protein product [Didymodactylos carnosus]CAF3617039.1 unnamed protein product [Didymodactylos carnosus]